MDAMALNTYLLPFLGAVVAGVRQRPCHSGKSVNVRAGWLPFAPSTTIDYQYRGPLPSGYFAQTRSIYPLKTIIVISLLGVPSSRFSRNHSAPVDSLIPLVYNLDQNSFATLAPGR